MGKSISMIGPTYELQKRFRFETAHRLSKDYSGKCSNIHGHSWWCVVAITCNKLDEYDMGFDFAELGKFAKQIEEWLDHKLLLYKNDPLVDWLQGEVDIIEMDSNPTSEYLAAVIYDKLCGYLIHNGFDEKARPAFVTIEETCTCACTFRYQNK